MTYRAILFDLDDTLFSLRGCEAQALRRCLDGAGLLSALPADYAYSYAQISAGYWAALNADGRTQFTREQVLENSWRDFLSRYSLNIVDAPSLSERFWSEFCRSSALNPGAEDLLSRLATRYRLGLLSNGYSDSQRGRLEAAGLTPYFEVMLISAEVGFAKPDARIFELALEQLRLSAADLLYVGDSISHDRAGSSAAGIDFCHYSPAIGSGDLPTVKYRIGSLQELDGLLLPP